MRLKDNVVFNYYKYSSKIFKKSSLKNKIKKDLYKGLFISFFFSIFTYINFNIFILNENIKDIFISILVFTSILFIVLLFMDVYLYNSVKKNIFNRFDKIKSEMKLIQDGQISKRLSHGSEDEIDEMIFFTNQLLDKLEDHIEYEKKYSLIDSLTNCYNRRALTRNSEPIISRAQRNNKNFTIAVIDLDNFKKLNDTYGHKLGDDVLVLFSKIVKEILRKHDSLYRIGGEEFLIILYDIDVKDSKKILERLRKEVPYRIKKEIKKISCNVTFSCGFVNSKDYSLIENSIPKMMDDADKLAYEAKNLGRDKIVY